MEPISDTDLGQDAQFDGPVDPTPLVPEIDSVSGGAIQEPAWPAPNREDDADARILNRVKRLRTISITNQAVANHLKALGLDA